MSPAATPVSTAIACSSCPAGCFSRLQVGDYRLEVPCAISHVIVDGKPSLNGGFTHRQNPAVDVLLFLQRIVSKSGLAQWK